MSGEVYFVVVKRLGQEESSIYFDWLPSWMTGKRATEMGLVYVLRLDRLPDAGRWLNMSLTDLTSTYRRLKAQGMLPPPNLTR